jgi:hypothetical protein
LYFIRKTKKEKGKLYYTIFGGVVIDISLPPEAPPEAAILIFVPYFAATIAAILYTNKQIKKGNQEDENSKDLIRSDNNNDD